MVKGWTRSVSPELTAYFTLRQELSTQDGCLMRGARLIIPSSLRAGLLDELHSGHLSVTRVKATARSYM